MNPEKKICPVVRKEKMDLECPKCGMKFESARINEYSMHYDAHAYCTICGEHTTALCKCQIEIDSLVKEIEAMPTKLQP